MLRLFLLPNALLVFLSLSPCLLRAEGFAARHFHRSDDPSHARLVINADQKSSYPIPPYITGKFAEHLGNNIVNGMDAQILLNPTFADYPIWNGETTPDGVTKFIVDEQAIAHRLRDLAASRGWPDNQLDGMLAARKDGLAALWTRLGSSHDVVVSPDTGPFGGRAQRVGVASAGQGLCQWAILPLHRVRAYEFELFARSPTLSALTVTITGSDSSGPSWSARIQGLSDEWRAFKGRLELTPDVAPLAGYRIALTTEAPGQFVVRHLLLRPADHVNGADPDIIRMLTAARLPLLRWPGGNFVSGYHWEDGIGPLERRPTRPNYAWGEIEPNLFGTDEFVAFCRAVGCEPMVCINAGNGTPPEAARWVEYCNGSATSPMGKLRVANGHPEPYRIHLWEVGNELWGRWQVHWTTAKGYVDRYKQFAAAMRAADPSIELQACGAPVFWGKQWNDALIAGAGPDFSTITDHPLIGGDVPPSVEPLDVYRDFMAVPEVLQGKWAALQDDMLKAGIGRPRLAVTELQLFAHLSSVSDSSSQRRLTHENLVRPPTLAEAIYDVLVYHAAIRLAPFVELVTHSAVVNHGGGLRKTRERVFANPCHYAQANFAQFANAIPVAADLACAIEKAPRVLPQLRDATPMAEYGIVDALAALDREQLLVSLVSRATSGHVQLSVQLNGFKPAKTAELLTLTARVPWAQNTPDNPQAVIPATSTVATSGNSLELELPPYSVSLLRINPL